MALPLIMVILVMITNEVLSFATDPLECLHQIWKYHGKKESFEMIRGDWPSEYWDLLEKMDPTLIEAWPNNEYKDASGQPGSTSVRIKPKGLELLHQLQRPREVHRQVTIDGKHVDLRNSKNHLLMTVPIEHLEVVAPLWLNDFKTEQDLRAFRALRMKLQDLLAYRCSELSPPLKNMITSVLMTHSKPSCEYPPENAQGRGE